MHETDLRLARPQRGEERHTVEDLDDAVAGTHAPRDLVERCRDEYPEAPAPTAHAKAVASDLAGCAVDSTGMQGDIETGECQMGAHLCGVLFGPSRFGVFEVTKGEDVHVADARVRGASAHRFVKRGGNENRRRHR